jgi:diguanylate cyclase (GGDEF)-like protein
LSQRNTTAHHSHSKQRAGQSADLQTTPKVLRAFAGTAALLGTPLMLAAIIALPESWPRWLGLAILLDLICAIVWVMIGRGRARQAAWLMTLSMWALLTAVAYTTGGLESAAIAAQLVMVVVAGLLLGWRRGVYLAVASTVVVSALAFLEYTGRLPASVVTQTVWSRALVLGTYLVVLGVLQSVIMRTYTQARDQAVHDASKRRKAESRLRQVIDNAPFGALGFEVRDDRLVATDANLSASAVLGMDASRLLGMDAETVLAGPGGTAAGHEIMRVAHVGGGWETDDFAWRIGKHSGIFEMHAVQTGADHAELFFTDVTAKRRAEAEIRHMAFHDELTGLPNRALLYDHLHMALASAQRRGDHVGLLFLDLDHFKQLNDRYGHAFGDLLLAQVSARLRQSARRGDTVARFGGDEFAVLLPDVESVVQAEAAAQKVLAVLEPSFEINNRTVRIGASIGVAIAPRASRDAVTLVHQADLAMYHVKADGRGGYRIFRPEIILPGPRESLPSEPSAERSAPSVSSA